MGFPSPPSRTGLASDLDQRNVGEGPRARPQPAPEETCSLFLFPAWYTELPRKKQTTQRDGSPVPPQAPQPPERRIGPANDRASDAPPRSPQQNVAHECPAEPPVRPYGFTHTWNLMNKLS